MALSIKSALHRVSTLTKNHTCTSKVTAWANVKSKVTSNTHRCLHTLHNGDEVFSKRRWAYPVPGVFKPALRNQMVDSFKVLQRVGNLAYKIDLSPTTFQKSFSCLCHKSSGMTADVPPKKNDVARNTPNDPLAWFIGVPYLSERMSLVNAAIKLLLAERVIVVRAPLRNRQINAFGPYRQKYPTRF